jgi:oligopeptide transport system substrate-binding protein
MPLIITLPLIIAGCARRETPVEIGNREQTLHLGNGSEPRELDPHVVTGVPEHNIISALMEGLVGEEPTTLAPVPGTAESWSISPDGMRYRFTLRPEARWSNGDPVTAQDFRFSYQRILSPGLGAPYADMLYCIRGAEAYHKGATSDFESVGVTAPDAQTLIIELAYPVTYFLSMLNHYAWYPVHPATVLAHGKIDQIGTRWTKPERHVGNGPFVLAAWNAGEEIAVTKSDTYWDHARVRLNRIVFHPIGNANTEEYAFRSGQLHVTGTIPVARIPHYEKNAPEVLRLDPYLGTYYYLFNVTHKPLDDVRVRQALSRAIDRERLAKYVVKAGQQAAFHFTPPGTGGYLSTARTAQDADEARALLAEAGFPGGAGFPVLSLLYNSSDAHAQIAQAIQQMWKQTLGIDIRLENKEWKVYLADTQQGRYDIARASWIGDYVDPNTFLDMWITGGGNNRARWSHARYDELIAQAARTVEPAARYAAFQEAEGILMEQVPITPLYFYRSKSLVQPSVKGWHPTLLDHHPYKHVYLEEVD